MKIKSVKPVQKFPPSEMDDASSDIEEIEFVEKTDVGIDCVQSGDIPVAKEIRVKLGDPSRKYSPGSVRKLHRLSDRRHHGDGGTQRLSQVSPTNTRERLDKKAKPKMEGNCRVVQGFSAKKNEPTDYISRNKSMVSENKSRFRLEKTNRRPMTAVPKKGTKKLEVGYNDPRTRTIVRSVNVSGFKPKDSGQDRTYKELETKSSEEWPILNEIQLQSFKKLFRRFDQDESGGITTHELFQAVQELVPDDKIPFEDVQRVHQELDIKQTGQIEFDEFLFAMTHPKNYLKLIQDDDRERLAKEIKVWENLQLSNVRNSNQLSSSEQKNENIFFTMVRTATRKESMREIRHFYVNKIKKRNDHVIQDWAAGQRCIGISNESVLKQFNDIMKKLNKMRKSRFALQSQYNKSPYAEPLQYGLVHLKLNSQPNKKRHKSPIVPKILTNADSDIQHAEVENNKALRRVKSAGRKGRTPTYPASDAQIILGNEKGAIGQYSKTVTGGRKANVLPKQHRVKSAPQRNVVSVVPNERETGDKRSNVIRSAPVSRERNRGKAATFKIVSLPVFTIKKNQQPFDYDSAEKIRRKAGEILQEYYSRLKTASASTSKSAYKELQVDQISDVQLKQFKRCYSAYLGGSDSFVISPWVPHSEPSPKWNAPLGESCYRTALT